MLVFMRQTEKQTERQTNRQGKNLYAPDLSIWGHKNVEKGIKKTPFKLNNIKYSHCGIKRARIMK